MAKSRGESEIKKRARKWFALHASEYDNLTEAAEDCAWAMYHDEWLDDPDHWVWELAIEYMPERNPTPYELRHFIVELTPAGETKRVVPINKYREATHDWSEATQIAANLNEFWKRAIKSGATGGFEVVSEPVYTKNPRGDRWPAPVTKIVELIWQLSNEHPDPEINELNPITVEHAGADGNRWDISFDEAVVLWGWNDGYVYDPKKRSWRVYLGDTGKTKLNWTTAQVEARVRHLMTSDEAVANPYRAPPETADEEYARFRQLYARYQGAFRDVQMLTAELARLETARADAWATLGQAGGRDVYRAWSVEIKKNIQKARYALRAAKKRLVDAKRDVKPLYDNYVGYPPL